MSGAACAVALRTAGVVTQVRERARSVGGRMASPRLHDRRVDLGAAYFTVADDDFRAVVDRWLATGLARPWTDTFDVFAPRHDPDDGSADTTTSGPMRYAAPGGLRSLVHDLAGDDVDLEAPVASLDDLDTDAVALAMPDPQAARIAGDAFDWVTYVPVIAVAAAWTSASQTLRGAAFVNDDPDITMIADDGSRRGDGRAVFVVHTSADRARRHLDDPEGAVEPAVAALRRYLDLPVPPSWTHAHRWRFARPAGTHGDQPYGLRERDGRLLGVCGDSWCPSGSPRIESAWLSGHRLGQELARRLTGTT